MGGHHSARGSGLLGDRFGRRGGGGVLGGGGRGDALAGRLGNGSWNRTMGLRRFQLRLSGVSGVGFRDCVNCHRGLAGRRFHGGNRTHDCGGLDSRFHV